MELYNLWLQMVLHAENHDSHKFRNAQMQFERSYKRAYRQPELHDYFHYLVHTKFYEKPWFWKMPTVC